MLHVGVTLCCLFFFFFKQKTAYEMRISDWSSDVCSSDLIEPAARDDAATRETAVVIAEAQIVANGQPLVGIEAADQPVELAVERSEERRVGKECVSTCRSRWSADH